MTLVYHHKVVVAPVDIRKVLSVGSATSARQVAMEKDIIAQAVFGNRIVQIIALIGNPVVVEFLRTEHQHRLVAVLVIFDDAQSGKRLTQTDTVGKYATVVLLQFVDYSQTGIFLEVIQLVPYHAVLEHCSLVGKSIVGKVVEKLTEDII